MCVRGEGSAVHSRRQHVGHGHSEKRNKQTSGEMEKKEELMEREGGTSGRRGSGATRRDGFNPNTTSGRRRHFGLDLHVFCLIEGKVEKKKIYIFFIEE